jgi:hypothetical protein
MILRLAISHSILIRASKTQLTWFTHKVSITCRALLFFKRLEATIWTYAIFEIANKTNLAKSKHFFSLSTLSADLGSLPAFQFIAQLTLGIRITLALAATVFAEAL